MSDPIRTFISRHLYHQLKILSPSVCFYMRMRVNIDYINLLCCLRVLFFFLPVFMICTARCVELSCCRKLCCAVLICTCLLCNLHHLQYSLHSLLLSLCMYKKICVLIIFRDFYMCFREFYYNLNILIDRTATKCNPVLVIINHLCALPGLTTILLVPATTARLINK